MDKDSKRTPGTGISRRSFLAASAAMIAAPRLPNYYGWIPPASPTVAPGFYEASDLHNFGKGKQAFLSNAYKKVTGKDWLTKFQFRGDCVGVGMTTGIDFLNATQTLQKQSSYTGDHSIVAHYVGAKVLAGYSPTTEGARLEWVINFFKEYGVLLAKKYGPDDLTYWNSQTYSNFASGLTDNLKIEAAKHPIIKFNKIRSYEETRDAVAAGFPGIIGSYMGVGRAKKDKDGFFYPSGVSPHCMTVIGVDDRDRPSLLILNSHGPNWAPGPKRYGFEPPGSAWIDAEQYDRYVNGMSDSWTISMFNGYKVKRNYIFW